MVGAFLEAVGATIQPCTFLLIAPIVAVVVAAGARWWAAVPATAAAVAGGWLLAANRWVLDGWLLRVSGALFAVAVGIVVWSGFDRRLEPVRRRAVLVPFAASMSFVASLWWRPCVGEELGVILTDAQSGIGGQLPGMTAYMLGAMVPVVAVVLARIAFEPGRYATAVASTASMSLAVAIGVALVVGRHGDVVVTLTRWTQS